jgi:hypothetical protein
MADRKADRLPANPARLGSPVEAPGNWLKSNGNGGLKKTAKKDGLQIWR